MWGCDSRGLWCSFGCFLLMRSTWRSVMVTTSLNILWNHNLVVNLYYRFMALSALRCCPISSDCLLSEGCTWVRTVLIQSTVFVCCWRTDGSGLHSVVMAEWMIISWTDMEMHRKWQRRPVFHRLFKLAVHPSTFYSTVPSKSVIQWVSSITLFTYKQTQMSGCKWAVMVISPVFTNGILTALSEWQIKNKSQQCWKEERYTLNFSPYLHNVSVTQCTPCFSVYVKAVYVLAYMSVRGMGKNKHLRNFYEENCHSSSCKTNFFFI